MARVKLPHDQEEKKRRPIRNAKEFAPTTPLMESIALEKARTCKRNGLPITRENFNKIVLVDHSGYTDRYWMDPDKLYYVTDEAIEWARKQVEKEA